MKHVFQPGTTVSFFPTEQENNTTETQPNLHTCTQESYLGWWVSGPMKELACDYLPQSSLIIGTNERWLAGLFADIWWQNRKWGRRSNDDTENVYFSAIEDRLSLKPDPHEGLPLAVCEGMDVLQEYQHGLQVGLMHEHKLYVNTMWTKYYCYSWSPQIVFS